MTTQDESTEEKVSPPNRRYRITQDRWCWCGRAAALIVVRSSNGEVLEPVCSEEHGQRVIDWTNRGMTPYGKAP